MHGISQNKTTRAFTLVELLVVIAIISILASLLLPALSKAMHSARIAACQSRQHQLYIATTMYADDNQERMPLVRTNNVGTRQMYGEGSNNTTGFETYDPQVPDRVWWGVGVYAGQGYLEPDEVFNCPDSCSTHYAHINRDGAYRFPEQYATVKAGGVTTITGSYMIMTELYYSGPGGGRLSGAARSGNFWTPDTNLYPAVPAVTSLLQCVFGPLDGRESDICHGKQGFACTYQDGHGRYLALPERMCVAWVAYANQRDYSNRMPRSGRGFWSWSTWKDSE